MSDELVFSEQAELNRYLFYSDVNDINIFVEDKDKEYEYETILTRLFSDEYHISSIFALGGKPEVIKAFGELGEFDSNSPDKINLYIVDGDFDRYLRSDEMIVNPHFVYLHYYNIENYLIDESAVVCFAKGKLHRLQNEVQKMINFDFWKKTIVNQAGKLFLLYCAVQAQIPQEPNVSRSEYLFIDDKTGFEKPDAYNKYYRHVSSLVPNLSHEINRIKEKYEHINGDDYFGLICGKFLLVSLYVYLRGICPV